MQSSRRPTARDFLSVKKVRPEPSLSQDQLDFVLEVFKHNDSLAPCATGRKSLKATHAFLKQHYELTLGQHTFYAAVIARTGRNSWLKP